MLAQLWYTNTYNLGYLPINSNRTYDRFGKLFNISRVIDSRGILDPEGYQNYSQAYLAAGNLVVYIFFFAVYSAMISYAALYHSTEIAMGFKNLWKRKAPSEVHLDKHNRLMKAYKEVPEWWYAIVLAIAVAMGCAGIAAFPTYTSVGVVFYGIALCIIFVIPIGIIYAVTGMQITLNVLAEFIGGAWVEGNATSLNFFKSFGYVTAAHALAFSSDLKLGHYCKIPPRHTFAAQIAATLVSTFVCVGVLNFQMNKIEGVCTPTQANHFTCPGINTFFTAAVLWGTIGPRRVFGVGGQYSWTLMAFPIGLLFPLPFWYFRRKYPRNAALRNLHPVILLVGNLMWAPYNLAYCIAGVPIGWLSMIWVKRRFLAFWSKYNVSPNLPESTRETDADYFILALSSTSLRPHFPPPSPSLPSSNSSPSHGQVSRSIGGATRCRIKAAKARLVVCCRSRRRDTLDRMSVAGNKQRATEQWTASPILVDRWLSPLFLSIFNLQSLPFSSSTGILRPFLFPQKTL